MVPSSTKILKTRWYLFFFGTVGTTAYQVCAKEAVPLELKWGAYSYSVLYLDAEEEVNNTILYHGTAKHTRGRWQLT